MILEYAIDPRVAANYTNLKLISALFGYSNPRRISKFPGNWAKLVHEESEKMGTGMNRTRVEEKLRRLKDQKCILGFNREYKPKVSWSANAFETNNIEPFHGIVSDATNSGFISSDNMVVSHPKFTETAPKNMVKSLPNLIDALEPLLRFAKSIYVIDPYFSPYQPSCQQLFKDIFKLLNTRKDANTVNFYICTSSSNSARYGTGDEEKFLSNMKTKFVLGNLDKHFSVSLAQNMHSRYLLTDIAGLIFDHSLSVDETAIVNISMMYKSKADSIKAKFFPAH